MTKQPDVALGILSADCLPVLLANEDSIGALHLSRSHLQDDLPERSIETMRHETTPAQNIEAHFGPCLRQESHSLDPKTSWNFMHTRRDSAPFFRSLENGDFAFDYPGYAAKRLEDLGVRVVFDLEADSMTNPDYFSKRQRSQGPTPNKVELNLSLICMRE